jgi:hypothetical protein
MRHVLVPVLEELGEDEWNTVAAGTVINPVPFKQFNQTVKKRG